VLCFNHFSSTYHTILDSLSPELEWSLCLQQWNPKSRVLRVNTFGSLLQMKVLKKLLHEFVVKVNLDELQQGSWYGQREEG